MQICKLMGESDTLHHSHSLITYQELADEVT